MKAARFYGADQPLKIETVPDPQPGPGEVLIAVRAAGICGTDLHIAIEGSVPTATRPITLGHEAAGVVTEVGPGVTDWQVGDHVCLMPHVPCGKCHYCTNNAEALVEMLRKSCPELAGRNPTRRNRARRRPFIQPLR